MKSDDSDALKIVRASRLQNLFLRPGCPVMRFNSRLNAYVTPRSDRTIRCLYGHLDAFRDWHSLRYGLGKIVARLRPHVGAALEPCDGVPEDAVVFSSIFAQTAVIVSASEGTVVKLARHIHAEHDQQCAQLGWDRFCEAGLQKFMPRVLEMGTLNDGLSYSCFALCANAPPFFRTRKGRSWPETLQTAVLPVLREFHQRAGFEVSDGRQWASHLVEKMGSRTLPAEMLRSWEGTLNRLEQSSCVFMPTGFISGDLQPQNVLFNGEQMTIIDWSCQHRSAIAIDVFCDIFYRAMAHPETENANSFWGFVAGSLALNQVPVVFRRTVAVWRQWLKMWLSLDVSDECLQLQLQGMCWDWLVSMKHPWLEDGTLWRRIRFPKVFLNALTKTDAVS